MPGKLRDGDAVITSHGFLFYIFGYDHPEENYNSFLKYVPEEQIEHFDMDWLDVRWHLKGITLLRPRELYSPEGYRRLVEIFRRSFPEYIHFSKNLGRWMITVPHRLIEKAFIPSRQLTLLMRRGHSDPLEENALNLIRYISDASEISLGFFGVHGSISIGMHHEGSDLDIAVYGRTHFRRMRQALVELESQGILTLKRGTRFERKQLNRGVFRSVDFVVNATRRFSEIPRMWQICRPVGEVEVVCRCTSAEEAMFRPAIYHVEECKAVRGLDLKVELVSEVVSMIGLYRNFVEAGEVMEAKGVLEEVVENPERRYFRVVVGSGLKGEYIDCVGL